MAAPIFDQLLSKGVRLVVISTTPTGALLANQFLQDTVLVDIYMGRIAKWNDKRIAALEVTGT